MTDKFFDLDYQLSKHFRIGEFKVSKSYPEMAEVIELDYVDVLTLKILAMEIIQPIRDKFGPIEILSGKRSPELNKAVGGSKNSDHLTGNAADLRIVSFDPEHIYKWIAMNSELPYRQVIYYPKGKFIHISNNIPVTEVKHEAFVYDDKGYVDFRDYFKE